MSMLLASVLPSLVMSFIIIHALCGVLTIRNPVLFSALFLAGFVADILCVLYELPTLVRVALINPLIHIVLPIACSSGALRQRLLRTGVIWLLDPVAELTSFAVVAALGMDPFQVEVNATNLSNIIVMYLMALLFYALACELAIRFFRTSDGRPDSSIAPPVLVFLLINTFFSYSLLFRMYGDPTADASPTMNARQVVTLVASCFVGILYGLGALAAARNDVASAQAHADGLARTRQMRHVSQRIEEAVDEHRNLAFLRHDLANQVGVISELMRTRHVSEARSYLTHLQKQACEIGGDAHE